MLIKFSLEKFCILALTFILTLFLYAVWNQRFLYADGSNIAFDIIAYQKISTYLPHYRLAYTIWQLPAVLYINIYQGFSHKVALQLINFFQVISPFLHLLAIFIYLRLRKRLDLFLPVLSIFLIAILPVSAFAFNGPTDTFGYFVFYLLITFEAEVSNKIKIFLKFGLALALLFSHESSIFLFGIIFIMPFFERFFLNSKKASWIELVIGFAGMVEIYIEVVYFFKIQVFATPTLDLVENLIKNDFLVQIFFVTACLWVYEQFETDKKTVNITFSIILVSYGLFSLTKISELDTLTNVSISRSVCSAFLATWSFYFISCLKRRTTIYSTLPIISLLIVGASRDLRFAHEWNSVFARYGEEYKKTSICRTLDWDDSDKYSWVMQPYISILAAPTKEIEKVLFIVRDQFHGYDPCNYISADVWKTIPDSSYEYGIGPLSRIKSFNFNKIVLQDEEFTYQGGGKTIFRNSKIKLEPSHRSTPGIHEWRLEASASCQRDHCPTVRVIHNSEVNEIKLTPLKKESIGKFYWDGISDAKLYLEFNEDYFKFSEGIDVNIFLHGFRVRRL